jgi:hypothetical protein
MKRTLLAVFILSIVWGFEGKAQTKSNSKTSVTLQTGYNRGYGIMAGFAIHNLAEGLPGNLRISIGLNWLDPGNGLEARRIFINNNTNGTLEKSGKSIDFRADYMMPTHIFNLKNSYLIFGPRYSSFKANFNFVGGNENFDVTTQQWGVGLGLDNYFKMNKKWDISFALGLDYFFDNTLTGHDTSYSPDGDDINSRNDNQNGNVPFTYDDADEAINQPQFMPRIMVGLLYKL